MNGTGFVTFFNPPYRLVTLRLHEVDQNSMNLKSICLELLKRKYVHTQNPFKVTIKTRSQMKKSNVGLKASPKPIKEKKEKKTILTVHICHVVWPPGQPTMGHKPDFNPATSTIMSFSYCPHFPCFFHIHGLVYLLTIKICHTNRKIDMCGVSC